MKIIIGISVISIWFTKEMTIENLHGRKQNKKHNWNSDHWHLVAQTWHYSTDQLTVTTFRLLPDMIFPPPEETDCKSTSLLQHTAGLKAEYSCFPSCSAVKIRTHQDVKTLNPHTGNVKQAKEWRTGKCLMAFQGILSFDLYTTNEVWQCGCKDSSEWLKSQHELKWK